MGGLDPVKQLSRRLGRAARFTLAEKAIKRRLALRRSLAFQKKREGLKRDTSLPYNMGRTENHRLHIPTFEEKYAKTGDPAVAR